MPKVILFISFLFFTSSAQYQATARRRCLVSPCLTAIGWTEISVVDTVLVRGTFTNEQTNHSGSGLL